MGGKSPIDVHNKGLHLLINLCSERVYCLVSVIEEVTFSVFFYPPPSAVLLPAPARPSPLPPPGQQDSRVPTPSPSQARAVPSVGKDWRSRSPLPRWPMGSRHRRCPQFTRWGRGDLPSRAERKKAGRGRGDAAVRVWGLRRGCASRG